MVLCRSCQTPATAPRTPVVLLVEDDPGDVLLVTEALERAETPPALHVAGDGQAALDFLHREGPHADAPRPDLILLDLNMPRVDGREALAAIKADKLLRAIPVVVLTTPCSVTSQSRFARTVCKALNVTTVT